MRVLITSVSGYGHFLPLLPMAQALVDARHEVGVAIAADMRSRAEAAGLRAFDAGLAIDAAFMQLAERFPREDYNHLQPDEILGWYLPHLFGEILAPAMLADLEPLVRDWRPDVILHETFEFAGPIAAASAGIPSVSHTLGLRIDEQVLAAVAASVAPLWRECGLKLNPTAGLYLHLCLDITPPSLQPWQAALSRAIVRPLRPVTPSPNPGERLPSWMQHRRNAPLVHMTLGTNTNSNISAFRSVLDGLSDLDVEVVMTVGYDGDAALLGPLPANAHVEQYIAHSLLLPHCTVVICHGGSGTTLAALALGQPLLLLPQGADQYIVGQYVYASGAGLLLNPAEVSPAAVRTAVLTLMNEPVHREAARRMQREIAAMPSPAEVVRLLEEVIVIRR